MPFVTKSHRDSPDATVAGDRCYVHYKRMMDAWKKDPRWTTADELFKPFMKNDENRAQFLAYMVFLHTAVMPYEDLKRLENGDI